MTNGRRVVGTPLPGAKLPYYPLHRPGPGVGGKLEGWILSPYILGIATHYVRGRTSPCTSHLGECEGCDFWKQRTRWGGFVGVLDRKHRRVAIFEATQAAVDAADKLDEIENLRGLLITLQRKGESREGRVVLSLTEHPYRSVLPAAPDVAGALERLWNVPAAFMGRAVPRIESGVTT